jgi:hypothetical protein
MKNLDKMLKKMVSDKEFNKELERITEMHKNYISKGKVKEFTPLLFVYTLDVETGKPGTTLIGTMFPDPDTKREVMRKVGAHFRKENPKEYPMMVFLASEAWMSKQSADAKEFIQPSKAADKKEVIVTNGVTIDGRNNTSMISFTRNRLGKMHKKVAVELLPSKDAKDVYRDSLTGEFFRGYTEQLLKTL